MLKAIQHEAFYNSGTLVDESLGVYVGWTALKSSFSDCMPLRNEREDVSLVFSNCGVVATRSVRPNPHT
jgi:asparagine synthase (glutamine-hydrolysing)